MLDWYLDHGLRLEDVKIKLEYSKSEWLKPYIEFNIKKRKEAKAKGDKFGDVFFKLMNNAFYGKTIENVYNRQDVELVNDVDRCIKLVENIVFIYSVEFDDDLVAVHKTRGNVKLDKFNYIGFVLLEKIKLFTYKAIQVNIEQWIHKGNYSNVYMVTVSRLYVAEVTIYTLLTKWVLEIRFWIEKRKIKL